MDSLLVWMMSLTVLAINTECTDAARALQQLVTQQPAQHCLHAVKRLWERYITATIWTLRKMVSQCLIPARLQTQPSSFGKVNCLFIARGCKVTPAGHSAISYLVIPVKLISKNDMRLSVKAHGSTFIRSPDLCAAFYSISSISGRLF